MRVRESSVHELGSGNSPRLYDRFDGDLSKLSALLQLLEDRCDLMPRLIPRHHKRQQMSQPLTSRPSGGSSLPGCFRSCGRTYGGPLAVASSVSMQRGKVLILMCVRTLL